MLNSKLAHTSHKADVHIFFSMGIKLKQRFVYELLSFKSWSHSDYRYVEIPRFHIPGEAWKIKALNMDFMCISHMKLKVRCWRYPAHVSSTCLGLRGEHHRLLSILPSILLSLVPISCCLNAPVLLQSTEMERAKEGGGGGGGERGRWRGS